MSITRVGSTKKFSDNWEAIFSGKGARKTAEKKPPAKKSRKKSAGKKAR